jgi:hypothetical protein
VIEPAELEVNVLEFLHKSFGFDSLATVDGDELAVFHRRETEDESKLRPRTIRLFVIVPRAQLVYVVDEDLVRIAPDGQTPGARSAGEAREASADATDFTEQGVDWHRARVPNGVAYVPRARAALLDRPEDVVRLGLG